MCKTGFDYIYVQFTIEQLLQATRKNASVIDYRWTCNPHARLLVDRSVRISIKRQESYNSMLLSEHLSSRQLTEICNEGVASTCLKVSQ